MTVHWENTSIHGLAAGAEAGKDQRRNNWRIVAEASRLSPGAGRPSYASSGFETNSIRAYRKEQDMTGYTVHSGTTIKFSEGWDRIFEERAARSAKGKAKKTSVSGAAKGQAKQKARVKRAAKGRR